MRVSIKRLIMVFRLGRKENEETDGSEMGNQKGVTVEECEEERTEFMVSEHAS